MGYSKKKSVNSLGKLECGIYYKIQNWKYIHAFKSDTESTEIVLSLSDIY
jgi:hypothetical protein